MEPRYPHIKVKLEKEEVPWTSFTNMGTVALALRAEEIPGETIQEWLDEASSRSFAHVLKAALKWVTVIESKGDLR